ncbi:MAG: asparaginase [Actinomycetota bacterium]|nr:MAG: asparaginase [Actinomycetota bacterium]
MRAEPLVQVVRSRLVESVHLGHVAVCDAEGRVRAWVGDPGTTVFLRSAAKPLQAAVVLSLVGEALPDPLVAVCAGSHSGEPVHVTAVRALLRRANLGASVLRCPPALPLDPRSMRAAGRRRPIYHNCSGKHAGMALACARAGLEVASYPEPSHPLQRRISGAVRTATGADRVRSGVDGCGVPVHGVTLRAAATAYARLLDPERLGGLAPHVARVVTAMRAAPYLVAGRGRADTVLMRTVPGLVAKVGAEALHCAAVPELGLGVAVKVADGGERAAAPALVRVLRLLGALDDRTVERLGGVARRPVLGGGRVVGELVPVLALHR